MKNRRSGNRFAVVMVIATAVALMSSVASAAPPTWHETIIQHAGNNSSEIDAMVSTGGEVWAFGFDRANIAGTFEWRVLGLHWNGSGWERLNTPDRETAPASDFIWGASATSNTDVWIVGGSQTSSSNRIRRNLVEHYDGQNWTIDDSVPDPGLAPTLLAVSARTPTDVWAVGEGKFPGAADYNGFVLHRTNLGWATVPFTAKFAGCRNTSRSELDAVDAVGPDDVYVAGWCGDTGFVSHWNGEAWTLVLKGALHTAFRELSTDPDGSVWVAGNKAGPNPGFPILYHGDAAAGFTQVPVRHAPTLNGNIDAMAVTTDGVFLAGQIWNTKDENNPSLTYALHLGIDGKWKKEAMRPNDSGAYARIHAGTTVGGTVWFGGNDVGGSRLDPVSAAFDRS